MKYPFNMLCRRWLLILNESCLPACCEKVAAVCPTQSSTKFESIICCIVAAVININCHGTRASFLEQIPNQYRARVFLFAFNPLLIMYSFLAPLSFSFQFFPPRLFPTRPCLFSCLFTCAGIQEGRNHQTAAARFKPIWDWQTTGELQMGFLKAKGFFVGKK